jgi:hypothetical protein
MATNASDLEVSNLILKREISSRNKEEKKRFPNKLKEDKKRKFLIKKHS